jgi:hypothetical protein
VVDIVVIIGQLRLSEVIEEDTSIKKVIISMIRVLIGNLVMVLIGIRIG